MQIATPILVLLLLTTTCSAIDWVAFDDPKTMVLTTPLAESIKDLPAAEKSIAIQRLHDSLESKEFEVRRRAALTLGSLDDKSGVPIMIEDLTTVDGRDRDNVVVAIRILKDDRSITALRKVLHDKSPYVRGIAVAALGEIKAGEAYDDIVAVTKDKEVQRSEKLNCLPGTPAHLACYALGALGDKRAVPVLIELLGDKELQGPAIQALEVLTNKKLGNDPEKWKDLLR